MNRGDRLLAYLEGRSAGDDRLRQKVAVFWRLARDLASLSCCRRAKVGCVVVLPDLTEVVAIGYNGPPAGTPNDGCRGTEGNCGCAHSEGNALSKLRGGHDLVMVTTTLQCEHCAGLVVNSGKVRAVVYGQEYRNTYGVDLLRSAGLAVVQVDSILTLLREGSDGED